MKKGDIYNKMIGEVKPYEGTIYLICCVGVEYDYDIFPHFIKYYKDLGVDEFLLILNTEDENSEKLKYVRNILKKYNIKEKMLWVGEFDIKLKTENMSEIILKMTNIEDWVIYVDVDEFQKYPIDLKKFIGYCEKNKYDCVMGEYIDRLTTTGKITSIDEDIDIWKAFPVETNLSEWNLSPYTKVLLAKSHVEVDGGHHNPRFSMSEYYNYFPCKLEVHHFKWKGNLINNAKKRLEVYKRIGIEAWVISKRLIDYYEKHDSLF